jgi:hypothetical protein
LLKRAQYDAEVMRERAEIAETATNEARAEAARQLYVGFEDGKNLGTVVDEMRLNLRKTSELNEAVRHDNDWLRVKLREARDAQAAFMAAPEGGWANLAKSRRSRAPSSPSFASRWSGCEARGWTPPPWLPRRCASTSRRTPTSPRLSRPSRAT